MAVQANKKERITNFIYSFFAGIVILGALFKITHISIGPLNGNILLTVGLVAEAIVFFYAAVFDQPKGDYEWEKVYPELLEGQAAVNRSAQVVAQAGNSLTQELDKVLAEAKLDKEVFESLRNSLDNFGAAVSEINKTTVAAAATQQYNDEISKAANNVGALNALYVQQIENSNKQVELNKQFIEEMQKSSGHSEKFLVEMQALSANINALNKVYGGMLAAMKNNN